MLAGDGLLDGEAIGHDVHGVAHVTFLGPLEALVKGRGDAGGKVALGDSLGGGVDICVDEPDLVHEGVGVAPPVGVERRVQALEDDDPRRRGDRNVVQHGVFDLVVETRRVDGPRLGRDRPSHFSHQCQVALRVKGEGGPAPKDGLLRVGHLRQLLARQVVPVQRNHKCDVWVRRVGRRRGIGEFAMLVMVVLFVEARCHAGGQGGLAAAGDAGDGDE